jgi:predicted  nucleic acid-binding Zn-ribbon protein
MREELDSLFDLLEEKVRVLLNRNRTLEQSLKKCEEESSQLKKENLELKSMLEMQSVRVDALLKKLEEALENRQKKERGVSDEKNGNV